MQLKFWGTRGSIASPGPNTIKYGGNTTCVSVSDNGEMEDTVIIDSGTGIRALGEEIINQPTLTECNIIFTHTHWDHIQGFPFFTPAYIPRYRINMFGCSKSNRPLRDSLIGQMDTKNFPISFNALQADLVFGDFYERIEIKNLIFETMILNHPGSGIGLKITGSSGKSLGFITDHELQNEPYNGYGFQQTVEFCEGMDVLVHDAQYLPEEYPSHKGWGHSSIGEVIRLAKAVGIPKIILFHHDPNRTDNDLDSILNNLVYTYGDEIEIFAAHEGMKIFL